MAVSCEGKHRAPPPCHQLGREAVVVTLVVSCSSDTIEGNKAGGPHYPSSSRTAHQQQRQHHVKVSVAVNGGRRGGRTQHLGALWRCGGTGSLRRRVFVVVSRSLRPRGDALMCTDLSCALKGRNLPSVHQQAHDPHDGPRNTAAGRVPREAWRGALG